MPCYQELVNAWNHRYSVGNNTLLHHTTTIFLLSLIYVTNYPRAVGRQVDEQRELALAEMRSHREFSHPNLMPLRDWALVRVPQGEAAFLLFPFMDRELVCWELPSRIFALACCCACWCVGVVT